MKTRIIYYLELLLLAVMVVYPILKFSALPESIPTHYNFLGEPDAYGSKLSVFVFPILGFIVFGIFKFMNSITSKPKSFLGFPPRYNAKQIVFIVASTNWLRFFLIAIICYLTIASIEVSLNHWATIGTYFVSIILAGTLLFVISLFIGLYRLLE